MTGDGLTTVLLVDDHPLVRQGLQAVLSYLLKGAAGADIVTAVRAAGARDAGLGRRPDRPPK